MENNMLSHRFKYLSVMLFFAFSLEYKYGINLNLVLFHEKAYKESDLHLNAYISCLVLLLSIVSRSVYI